MRIRSLGLGAGLLPLLMLFALASPARAQGDIEPNDTPGEASELFLPFTSVLGNVSDEQDIDFYRFVGEKGREITVLVNAFSVGSSLSPVLAFYDGTGDLLAYNDKEWNLGQSRPHDDPILYLKLPATGTFFVSVSSKVRFRNGPFAATGSSGRYSLVLFTKFFTGGAPDDPNEPNDALTSSRQISLPYESFGTNLIHLGDVDWYRFSARRGELLSIDIDALQITAQPVFPISVNARVGLFDEGGRLLQLSAVGPDPDDGFDQDAVISIEIPRDGRYFIAVAAAGDANFDSIFNDPDFLRNPYVSGATHQIGYYKLQVRVLQSLYFAQVANGSFGDVRFVTSIILVNFSSTRAAMGSINFRNADGTPLATSVGSGSAATHYFNIPARGSVLLKTDGAGPGASGYAVILATSAVGGSAIFSQFDAGGRLLTEAAVPDSPPLEFFTLPVDVTGDFNTGVALANARNGFAVNMLMRLISVSGQTVASRNITLGAGRQMALFVSGVDQLFPGISNFRGSLQVVADAPVQAVALRSSSRTLTVLPPVSLNLPFDPVTLLFPQVVAGTGASTYTSTLIFTNPGFFNITANLRFTRSDGSPLPVTIGSTTAAMHTVIIPPLGTAFLETSPAGTLESGYAVVDANHAVGGVVIFSQFDAVSGLLQTEAAVQPAPRFARFLLFAQADEGFNTGIAVANVSSSNLSLNYGLRPASDPAQILQRGPLSLEAGTHRAELISGPGQLFPEFAGRGTLEVASSISLPAVALRITATTMTALPVVPVP